MAGSTWFKSIPEYDRDVLGAWADWLKPVRWQFFVTATFPWNVYDETADLKFSEWINMVERHHSCRVGFVAGRERKLAGSGVRVPWHFHALLTAQVNLRADILQTFWQQIVGKGVKRIIDGVVVDEGILIEPYVADLKGAEYCLKSVISGDGEWTHRWLRFFNPFIKETSFPDHRSIRSRRRFEAAGLAFAS